RAAWRAASRDDRRRHLPRLWPLAAPRDGGGGGPLARPARHRVPLLPAEPPDFLEAVPRRQIEVIRREVACRIRRREPAEFKSKDHRARGSPLEVALAHEVLEAAPSGDIRIFRIVDTAASAEHPLGVRSQVELSPSPFCADRDASRSRVLADAAAAQSGERLSGE